MCRKLSEIDKMKSDFYASMSHELRTPLTVIRTAAFNLRGKVASNPSQVERYGALIQRESERLGEIEYEAFLQQGSPAFEWSLPANESTPIALNYTSGTTGRPKGVVYHHRGTFLEAVGNIMAWPLPPRPVYLWTLPLFHCNGWCFPWSVTAMGGTHVCLRAVDPAVIFPMIVEHGVTHMCGAPTVLSMLINAPEGQKRKFPHVVDIQTGGSPPPAAVLPSKPPRARRPRVGAAVARKCPAG